MVFASICLNKAVFIHKPHYNASCHARVRIDHDHIDRRDPLSVSVKLALVGFECSVLRLDVAPESVARCRVMSGSSADLVPSRMLNMLRRVTNTSAVVTLILNLHATDFVLVSPQVTTSSVRPAQQSYIAAFHAFAMTVLCIARTPNLRKRKLLQYVPQHSSR
jgi:hypothetical protein